MRKRCLSLSRPATLGQGNVYLNEGYVYSRTGDNRKALEYV